MLFYITTNLADQSVIAGIAVRMGAVRGTRAPHVPDSPQCVRAVLVSAADLPGCHGGCTSVLPCGI